MSVFRTTHTLKHNANRSLRTVEFSSEVAEIGCKWIVDGKIRYAFTASCLVPEEHPPGGTQRSTMKLAGLAGTFIEFRHFGGHLPPDVRPWSGFGGPVSIVATLAHDMQLSSHVRPKKKTRERPHQGPSRRACPRWQEGPAAHPSSCQCRNQRCAVLEEPLVSGGAEPIEFQTRIPVRGRGPRMSRRNVAPCRMSREGVGFWNVLNWLSRIVSGRVRRSFPVCSALPGIHFKYTVEASRL